MPPKARTAEEKLRDKQRIIDAALAIVQKSGLDALTIRKLSARLNMSATNIYNYFYNKDEIYMHVLINGFAILQQSHTQALQGLSQPRQRLEAFLRAIVSFSEEYPAYYQLMFSTPDPKSMDYIGSPIEKLAFIQKDTAMKTYYQLEEIVSSCAPGLDSRELRNITMAIGCEIHGFINYNLSHILREVGGEPEQVLDLLIKRTASYFD